MSGRLANTNPFVDAIVPGFWWNDWVGATTCAERIERISHFDAEQTRAALTIPELQKRVRQRLLEHQDELASRLYRSNRRKP